MAERGLRELSPGRDLINVRVPEDLTAQSKAAVFEIEVQVDPGLSPLDINVSAAIRGLMETHITWVVAETGKPLEEMRSAYEEAYKAHQEERLIVRATKLDSQLKKNKIKAERIRKALEDLRAGNRPD